MYLYKNNGDRSISVYSFVPKKSWLIEFKKKNLKDIKSVILHINNENTKELILTQPEIMFSALDRKEANGEVSYIEETNNDEIISKYVNGELDTIDPITVVGDVPSHNSYYSGNLINHDYSLLFEGGSNNQRGFVSDESILLSGCLFLFQPLLSDNINNLDYPDFLRYSDEETEEFLKMFNCVKQRTISLYDLRFLCGEELINFSPNFYDTIEKSEMVLDSYKRVRRKTS